MRTNTTHRNSHPDWPFIGVWAGIITISLLTWAAIIGTIFTLCN